MKPKMVDEFKAGIWKFRIYCLDGEHFYVTFKVAGKSQWKRLKFDFKSEAAATRRILICFCSLLEGNGLGWPAE